MFSLNYLEFKRLGGNLYIHFQRGTYKRRELVATKFAQAQLEAARALMAGQQAQAALSDLRAENPDVKFRVAAHVHFDVPPRGKVPARAVITVMIYWFMDGGSQTVSVTENHNYLAA